jgi:transcriptional regulator with XRE-family HTH domain
VQDLFIRLERLGITQQQLATVLDVSPSHLSKLKHRQRRWPSRLVARAATFIAGAENHVVATVNGHW